MSQPRTIELEPTWLEQLNTEFEKPYMQSLREFLTSEKSKGKVIFPAGSEYFNALNTTAYDDVKVVILGQDPYHGPGQAHGLCFSVREGVRLPPSLVNIYKEIQSDLGLSPEDFKHGCLESWASQGVLLLNSVLTVERSSAASHQGKGWETFTDKVIESLSNRDKPCVFLLWGSYAQKKGSVIDRSRHRVLTAPHPSPLSAHRGFFGCRHFSECNRLLEELGETPIDWRVLSS
ncbi:MAG: uracil-DNA glycosylase [Gammaproteobacteria bacterium]|nr:uracil-DNA glycosylase [Gammaproteobacteria bacterium]MBT4493969.1 uracil-DNA glycosylase [Gammaproteobacteria bacterium]MBT7372016.1 uracil-DNA glycosylase [Gammaproteobacteria bacterium]